MISDFDDYPIHQLAQPVNQPGPSDRNFYDRYWFNGFDRDGAFDFEIGLGLYPNRRVMDGHFSVAIAGRQHSFHASRRAPGERSELKVGPLRIEIVRPMRLVRVRLEKNSSGIECDLTFRARTAPTQEPKNVMHDDLRLIMESCRFAQFGAWEGFFEAAGARTAVAAARTLGARDRSWGVRPVGEPEMGAPGLLTTDPGVYWVWAPIDFGDVCTQFRSFEDREGNATELSAAIVPAYASIDEIPAGGEPGHQEMATAKHRIEWEKGTRRPRRAEIELIARDGKSHLITLEPMMRFQLLGIGYQHPEWGHGFWKGDEATGSEAWDLADLDPLDYKHIHVHQICKARMGDRVGAGTLETIVFGRHVPSGFESLLDGAK
jgi:hypothetical protein